MRGGVDGIGNPGMVCARAFDGRGRSTFTSGAEDAFGDRDARAAKGDAVFFHRRVRVLERWTSDEGAGGMAGEFGERADGGGWGNGGGGDAVGGGVSDGDARRGETRRRRERGERAAHVR